MKKYAALVAATALVGQLATPAFAAGAFNDATMLGWQQRSAPAAMAYFSVPFHAERSDRIQPRAGLMITAPQAYYPGAMSSRVSKPGMVDLAFTGNTFDSPWTATLNVQNQVAWASDPKALPKNTKQLFESGVSWVVVGALSAGIIIGVYALSDRSK